MREEVGFYMFLKKMTLNCGRRGSCRFFILTWRILTPFVYQEIEIVANCIRNRFQQKDLIEALQAIEILLLKALREEDFGHELQKMSSFFSSDLHKLKLKTQLKTLTHIVDEKQVGIKDAITIISSLNASQKLLISEVLRLVKLML